MIRLHVTFLYYALKGCTFVLEYCYNMIRISLCLLFTVTFNLGDATKSERGGQKGRKGREQDG